jgi:hypothetical protein
VEEVPAAASMFKRASEILGYDLLDVCVNGPKEKLDSTAVRSSLSRSCSHALTQPAATPGEPAGHLRRLSCDAGEDQGTCAVASSPHPLSSPLCVHS